MLAATAAMQAKTPEKIPLYDGKVPNSRTTLAKPEKIVMSGSDTVYKPVAHPTLTICWPDTPNAGRPAIVICPGGGYFQTSYTFEGLRYAEELNKSEENRLIGKSYYSPDDFELDVNALLATKERYHYSEDVGDYIWESRGLSYETPFAYDHYFPQNYAFDFLRNFSL